jgi:hypothetical protein
MAFNGREGEQITLATAAELTANYRNQMQSGEVKGYFIGKEHLNNVLAQTDCEGIRIYFGMDEHDVKVLVLVGATATEDDLHNGIILDRSVPCPSRCGRSNSLNS